MLTVRLQDYLSDAVTPILDYFEDSYIGWPLGHCRKTLIFPLKLWNMYTWTDQQLPRTNNAIAGWHHSFQAGRGSYYPNFWRFLSYLISEYAIRELCRSQRTAGQSALPQRKRYADCNLRLLTKSVIILNIQDWTICMVMPATFHFNWLIMYAYQVCFLNNIWCASNDIAWMSAFNLLTLWVILAGDVDQGIIGRIPMTTV